MYLKLGGNELLAPIKLWPNHRVNRGEVKSIAASVLPVNWSWVCPHHVSHQSSSDGKINITHKSIQNLFKAKWQKSTLTLVHSWASCKDWGQYCPDLVLPLKRKRPSSLHLGLQSTPEHTPGDHQIVDTGHIIAETKVHLCLLLTFSFTRTPQFPTKYRLVGLHAAGIFCLATFRTTWALTRGSAFHCSLSSGTPWCLSSGTPGCPIYKVKQIFPMLYFSYWPHLDSVRCSRDNITWSDLDKAWRPWFPPRQPAVSEEAHQLSHSCQFCFPL